MTNKKESPLVKGLIEYFENTPSEQLEKDFKELEQYNQIGPDVLECLNHSLEKFNGIAEEIERTKESEERCIFRRGCIFNSKGVCIKNPDDLTKRCTAHTDCERLDEYDRVHACLPDQETLDRVHSYIKQYKE